MQARECSFKELENVLNGMPYGFAIKNEFDEYSFVNKCYEDFLENKMSEAATLNYIIKETYKTIADNGEFFIEGEIIREIFMEEETNEILEQYMLDGSNKDYYSKNTDTTNYDNLINTLINNLSEKLKVDGVILFKYNEEKNFLSQSYVKGLDDFCIDDIQSELEQRMDSVNKENLLQELVNISSYWYPYLDEYGAYKKKRYLRYDIVKFEDRIIGIIAFIKNDVGKKSNYEIYKIDKIIKMNCNNIAILINNKVLSNNLMMEIEKCKRSEEKFRLFIERSVDGISDLMSNYDASNMLALSGNDKTENYNLEKRKRILESNIHIEKFRNKFLTNMSYEFKYPLSIILSTVQLFNLYSNQKRPIGDMKKKDKYIDGIKRNSYNLLKIVNNLTDINKIESNQYKFNGSNYNIVEIIEDVLDVVNSSIKHGDKPIIFDTDDEEIILFCDKDMIEKVLLKLLSILMRSDKKDEKIEIVLNVNKIKTHVNINIKSYDKNFEFEEKKKIYNILNSSTHKLAFMELYNELGLILAKYLIQFNNGEIFTNNMVDESIELNFKLPIKVNNSNDKNGYLEKSLNSIKEQCYIELS